MAATVAQRMADRTLMNSDLLRELVVAVAAYERVQRRFRETVMVRLSRIETLVEMIHGAQLFEAHRSADASDEKLREAAKHSDTFILEKSKQLSLAAMNYIYADSEPSTQGRRTPRKQSE